MGKPSLPAVAAAMLICNTVSAEVPKVATDIAPVQSLVAQVMGDLGTPEVILPPGASPHGHSMRPSEARALASADAIFWIGADLTPWLARSIETLGTQATVVELTEVSGVTLLDFREGATFERHAHDADEGEADAAEHHDQAQDHDEDHDGHDENHEGDHDDDHDGAHAADDSGTAAADPHDHAAHAHHGKDPHVWLDPVNAEVWLGAIAGTLSTLDPEHAAVYAANASAAQAALSALTETIAADLAPMRDTPFIVFHDAYQYFENRFGLSAAGAISLGDAQAPSAARIAEIRQTVRDLGVACVASEPQFSPELVAAISDGTEVKATVLDPIGAGLEPGAAFYGALMENMAEGLLACR